MKAVKAMKGGRSYTKVWATEYMGQYCKWRLKKLTRALQSEDGELHPQGVLLHEDSWTVARQGAQD
jgi:hypothetical protein